MNREKFHFLHSDIHRYCLLLLACVSHIFCVGSAMRELTTINDGWRFSFAEDSCEIDVHLPHCWNIDAYDTADYRRGVGKYSKKMEIPARFAGKKILMKIDGAANSSVVSLDGKEVGRHVGGYSPQVVDITDLVVPGKTADIEIEVDNSSMGIPPLSGDFTFMGGLYRDVWLIALDPVHLDLNEGPASGFRVETFKDHDGKWRLNVSGRVVNESSKPFSGSLRVILYGPDGKTVAAEEEFLGMAPSGNDRFSMEIGGLAGMEEWTPETPVS